MEVYLQKKKKKKKYDFAKFPLNLIFRYFVCVCDMTAFHKYSVDDKGIFITRKTDAHCE